MANPQGADEIYGHFLGLVGSELIASKTAIRGLIRFLTKRQPDDVLEVGAGIGTLTFTILVTMSHKNLRLTCLEDNDFCLVQMKENLRSFEGQYEVYPDMSLVNRGPYDFVVIDGGGLDPRYFTNLSPRAVVFIETDRSPQRRLFKSVTKTRRRAGATFIEMRAGLRGRKCNYFVGQLEPTPAERATFAWTRTASWLKSLVLKVVKPEVMGRPRRWRS